jgi:amino acid adenylation domain-containing protein/non-ribosomal peptide synthase protein (TIGR01720 family)
MSVHSFHISQKVEWENKLKQHPDLREAVVIASKTREGSLGQWVAYVVAEPHLEKDRFTAWFEENMPGVTLHFLEKMPLTEGGEVDLAALPMPKQSRSPQSESEKKIAVIWSEFFEQEEIDVYQDFFELGGDDELAEEFHFYLQKMFQLPLPMELLEEAPTIAQLAERIEAIQATHHADGSKESISSKPVIERGEREYFPMSPAQQRLWFFEKFQPNTSVYHIPFAMELTGHLQESLFKQSIQQLVDRHESLRTTFTEVDGKPVQVIREQIDLPFIIEDLSQKFSPKEIAIQQMREWLDVPFDLERGPLLRVALFRLSSEKWIFFLAIHHMISDGWSMGIFVKELFAIYEALLGGNQPQLAELSWQYVDYTLWQDKWLAEGVEEKQLAYWREQLHDLPVLQLPTDRPRPAQQTYRGSIHTIKLPLSLTKQLQTFSQVTGSSLYMVLLAGFQTLLHRYTGQVDLAVGSPIAGRNRPELEGIIGFFINTLVFRTDLSGNPSFNELVNRVRDVALGAYAHQDVPFERVVDELQPERSLSYSPLIQVLFTLQNMPLSFGKHGDLHVESISIQQDIAKFDLTLTMAESAEGLVATFEYNSDLFDHQTIERMAGHFQQILQEVMDHPGKPIGSISMLSKEEVEQLKRWNDEAKVPYPRNCSVVDLFLQQVMKRAEQTAVVFGEQSLTYDGLNRQANQLARFLQKQGVGSGTLVGVAMERSLEVIVALLAVVKAGAAYVPLDPTYPRERLAYMAQDAQVQLILTMTHLAERWKDEEIPVWSIDLLKDEIASESEDNLPSLATGDDLIYVMYTSGSTGKPKGVEVLHRGVVRLVYEPNYAQFSSEEVFLQLAPLAFDASTLEIWGSLLHGAKLVMMPPEQPSLEEIAHALKQNRVTTLWLAAGLFQLMVEEQLESLLGLRQLLVGGDVVSTTHVKKLLERSEGNIQLINGYGPTENTTFTCCYPIPHDWQGEGSLPIGRPINNTEIYILDRYGQQVPIGVPGELYAGGDGLARGYHRRPELTAERFVKHPFSSDPAARLYRTGDLVRLLPDGQVEFLGRIDQQVKVRGFRIELGEIETVLQQHPLVKEAVVIVREDQPGDKRLVAYLVYQEPPIESIEWRSYLQRYLPEYMVPYAYVALEKLPLNPNGKVDRKALPAPVLSAEEEQVDGFRTPIEEMIAGIWSDVLQQSSISREKNFFELGGNSLLATQVVSRINQVFMIQLPLRTLFEKPTVAQLAPAVEQFIRGEHLDEKSRLQPRSSSDCQVPLSYAQQRLWFLDRLLANRAVYNIPFAIRIKGNLNPQALRESWQELWLRHPSLRMVCEEVDGQGMMKVMEFEDGWREVDLSQEVSAEEIARQWMEQDAAQPFDLEKGPLTRVSFFRISPAESIFYLNLHHIIADGWSLEILVDELFTIYEAKIAEKPVSLPVLPIQYSDYALWQREQMQEKSWERQLSYWKQQLANVPVLQLPTDFPRSHEQTFQGATYRVTYPTRLVKRLERLSQQHGATLFMTLLAALNILLKRYSGQEDIAVGSPIAGRNVSEVEGLIGLFVNTLVYRTDLSGNPNFTELLKRVREVALGAYTHQDLPFEKIVDELQPERSLSHTPLFQVMFALQNLGGSLPELAELTLEAIELSHQTAKFDLTIQAAESEDGLIVAWEYNRQLFAPSTIARMAEQFGVLLEGIVESPETPIAELPILTEREKQLFTQWNETDASYPQLTTVCELIAHRAATKPLSPAVVSPDGTKLTYQELNHAANQIARYLYKSGVEPGSVVGVCLERSSALVVALLAVMKVGAAYLPIDPTYPKERISYMLEDAKAEIVLTLSELTTKIPMDEHVICLDTDWAKIHQESRANFHRLKDLDQLAYVIYTSGSTGKPKGVAIQHRSLLNLIFWHRKEYELTEKDRTTMLAGVSFDASVWEIWPTLSAGGSLYIPDEEIRLQPEALRDWLIAQEITISFIPTPLLEQLLFLKWPQSLALRKLLTGGDQLRYYPPDEFPVDVVNHYGPTENTVVATAALVPKGKTGGLPSIGRPIANTKVYVLDSHLQPVPLGVPGELYLGGKSLALGYLHRPELTAERFIIHDLPEQPEMRLYKTGDLVRFLPDGQLEYLGRTDQQVKIRGYRIELGEIEAVISQYPAIKETVVIAREDQPGEKRLVGYVVVEDESSFSSEALLNNLKQQLPEYMIPAAIVVLDALPLTANGKIDRRALPAPDWSQAAMEREYVAPRTEEEQRLAAIWQQVLRLERVGIYDNFFALGGDSILSIQIVAKARQQGLQLSPKQIFENQTIAELAQVIGKVESVQAEQGRLTGEVPLTPIQKWFFMQEIPDRHHWNQSMMLLLKQRLQPQQVAQTLFQLQAHHDALRLRFTQVDGEWQQWYSEDDSIPFRYVDLSDFSLAEQKERIETIAAETQSSLNLNEGPIWQVVYFDLGEEQPGRLLWVIHHLAVDGVSWRILLEDFTTGIEQLQRGEAIQLPEKTSSLRQWANQLLQYAQEKQWNAQEQEWFTPMPVPPIPVDQKDGANTEAEVESYTVSLSKEETDSLLRRVTQKYRAQIDEVLLAALGSSLLKWSDAKRFCIHLESHGREEEIGKADLSRTVGWLTSLYPVYLDFTGLTDELELIKAVKEKVRRIPRKGLDYGIFRYLTDSAAVSPIEEQAEISFNYLGQFDQATQEGTLFIGEAPESRGRHTARSAPRPHLLDVVGGVVNGQLHLTWMYSKQVHHPETIAKLAENYLHFVRTILNRQEKVYCYTPVDFPLSSLTQQEIDQHLSTVEVDQVYPLAPLQEGLWFHSLVEHTVGDYVVQMKFAFEGNLDVNAWIGAWQKVVEQYDVLRTAVLSKGVSQPHQVVYRQVYLPFEVEDWSNYTASEQEERLREYLQKDRQRGFDLSQAPMMRCALFRCGEERYQFVWSYHHFILDGWSVPQIFQALFAYYEKMIAGESPRLNPAPPYADYIAWLKKQDQEKAEEFWRTKLQGFTEPTILPSDQSAVSEVKGADYQQQLVTLPKEITQRLLALAQRYRITLNTVVQGAWAYLLSRYCGKEDVVFGATVSGRPADLPQVNQMVGLFINSLPVRLQIPNEMKVSNWLQQIQLDQLQIREYEYTPLVEIQRLSELPAGTALFETLVVFENYPIGNVTKRLPGDLQLLEADGVEQVSYPLTLIVAPGEELSFKWMYDSHRFSKEMIARMSQQLETILTEIVADPEQEVSTLELLPAAEQRLLAAWNQTEQPYPENRCIHEWVAEQANRTPYQTAIIAGKKILTYRQLEQKANQLARYLQKRGVKPGVRVGILLERSLDLVVSLLAVLKAGGTYVPLDPAYPKDRLHYMLTDSNAKVVITQKELRSLLNLQSVQLLIVDQERKKWLAESIQPIKTAISAEQLAYLIYTSGSTGRPKGVMIAHRNVSAFLQWAHGLFTSAELEGVLASTSICFDLSIFELFVPLSSGGTVILAENALQLPELSAKHQVTLINTVPSAIAELLRLKAIPPSVRTVNLAGEPLPNQLAQELYRLGTVEKVYNLYGPSEDTTYSTYALVEKGAEQAPAIGRPLANTAAYVLDTQLRPVPIGVPGELYLSGAGLAQGYLNQEELTAERFIWHSLGSDQPIRLYKTGDIVRYRADGQLEFLGRVDHQVKIRGYRIELGEIEAVLRAHETIYDAVVMARKDRTGDSRLVAYVIAERDEQDLWRQHIRQKLPEYMMPTAFVMMESFPLTPNGKLDRKAFPEPEAIGSAEEYIAPQTEVEKKIASIWSEVIKVERVGREDHFFMLGGHSLLATQAVSRVQDIFQIELPLRTIFEKPRLSEFAEEVEKHYRTAAQQLPKLKPCSRQQPLPLSYAQQRLWFLERLQPESTAYNLPFAIRLKGPLDLHSLEQSFYALQKRHETLRTSIQVQNGEAVQVIAEHVWTPIPIVDLQDQQEPFAAAMADIEEDLTRPFQLEQAPLFRMKLYQLAPEDYLLYANMHHIISDGWSMQVFFDEWIHWYRLYQKQGEVTVPSLPIQYADFSVWQREWLQSDRLAEQLEYWKEQLADVPVLQLPTDFPRLPQPSFQGDDYRIALPAELVDALEKLGKQEDATLFMTLLAAFQVLLSKYSGQTDFAIGSPIAGRNQQETEKLIGFFVNTLALRADLTDDPTFLELLKRVRETALAAFTKQDVPFEQVVNVLQPERSLSHTPLFQVMFALQNVPAGEQRFDDLSVESVDLPITTAKYDLTLTIGETEKGHLAVFEYNTDLFRPETIQRMAKQFLQLLETIVAQPEKNLSVFSLLTEDEQAQLIAWNQTAVEYPTDRLVHEWFTLRARQLPKTVAIIGGERELTYGELNRRANQLAHYLRKMGIQTGDRVGICFTRSIELIVAIVGTLKAGATYVPIDPAYPSERIQYICQDAELSSLLTTEEIQSKAMFSLDVPILFLDREASWLAAEPESEPAISLTEEAHAYLIYTSGSTGRPKGVTISHRSLLNLLFWHIREYQLTMRDRTTLLAGVAFDASVWEIWPTLAAGATLVIVPDEVRISPENLRDWLIDQAITISFVPTPLLESLLPLDWPKQVALRKLLTGGDQLHLYPSVDFPIEVINHYGPTECTVVTTRSVVPKGKIGYPLPPIGRPIANTEVYVLDSKLNPVPIGVPGELYIGGVGVAEGYHRRPELTDERFVQISLPMKGKKRLYKTGDLVRYLPDGNLEFLGRIDQQVQIRGYRVELGEIESLLGQHPAVKEVVVIAREEQTGNKQLVAYLVLEGESGEEDWANYLAQNLPEYMIPAHFVLLEAMPLTANGKIDRRALPEPVAVLSEGRESQPPQTVTEKAIARIWSSLLNVAEISRQDHFFALGGHSILATQVISRINEAFGIELPLRTIFEAPTLSQLAKQVEQHQPEEQRKKYPPLVRKERKSQCLPASFAQKRLWFLNALLSERSVYNIPLAIRLRSEIDVAAMEYSFQQLIKRHESLRTVFMEKEGQVMQVIREEMPEIFTVIDLMTDPKAEEVALARIQSDVATAFDLEKGPLVRASLYQLAPDQAILAINLHHIIADGWSMSVLLKELLTDYQAKVGNEATVVPENPIQYADFTLWQQEWLQGDLLQKQVEYWKEQLSDVPVLQLPTDRPRLPEQTFRGDTYQLTLSPELRESLEKISQQMGTTLFMTLLAGFKVLLYHYTGQEDLAVGSPIAGRNHPEVENLIGFFINTLVLRTNLSGEPSFRELLSRVRKVTLDAYAHQDIPLEKVVEEVAPERHLSHTPLFQVMFSMQNTPREWQAVKGLQMETIPLKQMTTKFDLTVTMAEEEEGLLAAFEYNTDLFEHKTIQRLAERLVFVLEQLAKKPDLPISQVELLTPDEKKLLEQWNETKVSFPQDRLITEWIEAQAQERPTATAVVSSSERLTYQELNQRANQLARALRRLGVDREKTVAVCCERSPDYLIGILAVLKAGGAYVPIDPAYPIERIAYMLQDAKVEVLLTHSHLEEKLPASETERICIDRDHHLWQYESVENLPPFAQLDSLCYVVYTSGSTGKPKGVMICHRSLLNLVTWHEREYQLSANDRTSLLAGLAFDASVWEVWPTLAKGATLYLPTEEERLSPEALRDWLIKNAITISFVPTPLLENLLQISWPKQVALRKLLTGGDQLRIYPPHDFPCEVVNHYGPTENTVVSTAITVPAGGLPERLPTIGRPIANTEVYVLNAQKQRVPIGVVGELYVGGVGLARGYFGQEKLTQESFIPHPFSPNSEARLYRTGDLARFLLDGTLEFLGRADHQVKIRGFRVELGEIEVAIQSSPAVQECVVIAREDQRGQKRLVAYLVVEDEEAFQVDQLRQQLKKRLPDYMIPAAFVKLKEIPLTANGKVDRRALPEPTADDILDATNYTEARNQVEEKLVEIWRQVLRLDRIGVHDNFFQLGGDSIISLQVVARAKESGLHLTPKMLFEHQTIAELAAAVGQTKEVHAEQGLVTGEVPFTPIQHWFFEQSFANPHHWNQSMFFEVSRTLQPDLLKQALQSIQAHHDALRLRFIQRGAKWIQVHAELEEQVPLHYIDLSKATAVEQTKQIEEIAQALQSGLDLAKGPLWQVAYFHLGSERPDCLLWIAHHLLVDGVSWRILLEDLQRVYEQLEQQKEVLLPPKTTSFKEWAMKLETYAQTEEVTSQLDYWKQQLLEHRNTLPLDQPTGRNLEGTVTSQVVTLTEAETEQLLQKVPTRYHAGVQEVLLTSFAIALSRWTKEQSLLIHLEGHGREEVGSGVDLSRTVGWFTSIYPVRLQVESQNHHGETLRQIKEQLRQIPQNGIGYGLIQYLSPLEDWKQMKAAGMAEVSFNYLGQFDSITAEGSLFKGQPPIFAGMPIASQNHRPHLIDVVGAVKDGKLHLSWLYSKELFFDETIRQVADDCLEILRSFIREKTSAEKIFVPSDFPEADLSEQQLQKVLSLLKKRSRS